MEDADQSLENSKRVVAGEQDAACDFYTRWNRAGQTAVSHQILEIYYRYAMLAGH